MSFVTGMAPQGRTPSRFLSTYFNSQCNLHAAESPWDMNLSQTEGMSASQGMFGTPDFITPQEHQFTVGHNPEDPAKDARPMRSPCPLSPGGRKKTKRFVANSQDSDIDASQEANQQHPSSGLTPAGATPSSSTQAPRGSILHYVKPVGHGKPPSSARKRGIMPPPPPIRSPPPIRNPFLEGPDADANEQQARRQRIPSQLPASRYRADFKELAMLGTGAFSKVYKVKSRIDGAHYAIKRTSKEIRTPREKDAALQEVQAFAAAGPNPSLVQYFGAWLEPGSEGEHLFIQLELCGESLSAKQASGHVFTDEELLDILKQVAAGLRHLHSRGMAHLDIKPDNIYVSSDQRSVKVGDFGLMTRMDGATSINEGDGRYLPQEMLNGDHKQLDKVDMFSLGATILELASGEPLPKDGDAYQALRRGSIPMPPTLRQGSLLTRSIKALMSENPGERPSADAVCRGSIAPPKTDPPPSSSSSSGGRAPAGGLGLVLKPSNYSNSAAAGTTSTGSNGFSRFRPT